MKDTFFITTPIYYTNGIPHIGHAYSTLIADTIARNNKINGKKTKFSTGVDENSQKVVEKAEEKNMSIEEYLDLMADEHKKVWNGLKIDFTDFIRTTDKVHHKLVQEVLQKSFNNVDGDGNRDIYEGEYEGMYCVGCEAFKKDEDLVYLNKEQNVTFPISDKVKVNDNIIKVCPDHLKTPDTIKEKNYFFKLSKYEDKLKEFYKNNPDFVTPSDRFNEVKAFVDRGLEDFSISRETNKFGVKLPFDESQVTYVWYDALYNYVTVTTPEWEQKECSKSPKGYNFWPADLHVVGKDIIRFHAIYWPAMLMSAGYELPKQILTTGFFTVDGQKISKSLGNAIDPVQFSEEYSKDLLTLYLLSSFNIGQDGDFDQKQAVLTYNAKLANNFGNLVNRVVVLTLKLGLEDGLKGSIIGDQTYCKGIGKVRIGKTLDGEKINNWLYNKVLDIEFDKYMNDYNLKGALDISFYHLNKLNKYLDEKQPWTLIKDESKREEVIDIFYTIAEGLRQVGLNLYSFFPQKMGELFSKIGLEGYVEELENGKLKELRERQEVFMIKEKGEVLFERVDVN